VLQARDGQFYGSLTQYAPATPIARHNGALFKMTVDGTLTVLETADQDISFSTLVEGADGAFTGRGCQPIGRLQAWPFACEPG
jgi:hypothetical protein